MDDLTQKAIKKFPHRAVDIAQSYDKKQIACKQWLYDELKKIDLLTPDIIYIAGGWFDSIEFEYGHMLINTSCEHMRPLNVKPRTYVVLQSNNYRTVEDHINCVDSCDELVEQYELSHTYYTGSLDFPTYTRFMVIGKK